MFLILRIRRSYLEQVVVIFLPHPPEVVLCKVLVGWVEIAGLNHHLSINIGKRILSKHFFHKPKVTTRLLSCLNTVAENVLHAARGAWQCVGDHSKKTKAELRNDIITKPKAALKRAQESQRPSYWVLAKRGWSRKTLAF